MCFRRWVRVVLSAGTRQWGIDGVLIIVEIYLFPFLSVKSLSCRQECFSNVLHLSVCDLSFVPSGFVSSFVHTFFLGIWLREEESLGACPRRVSNRVIVMCLVQGISGLGPRFVCN